MCILEVNTRVGADLACDVPRPRARRSRTHGTSTFQCHTASQITIQRILSDLPCIERHAETLAGKASSLLHNISGEFSRLPLDRILCHGAHDMARDLADRASGNRRSSEFFAGWPKILDGHTGPFWVSSFVHGGFSDSCSDSGGGRAVLVLSLFLALLTVGVLKCYTGILYWVMISVFLGYCSSQAVLNMQAVHIGLGYSLTFLRWLLSGPWGCTINSSARLCLDTRLHVLHSVWDRAEPDRSTEKLNLVDSGQSRRRLFERLDELSASYSIA